MGDKDKEIPGSSGRWKIPKVKESTELLYQNHAGFIYTSDDDDGSNSETEPENASLTPSMSLAGLRLTPSQPSSSSHAGPPKITMSVTKPLAQIQGQTVLVPPGASGSFGFTPAPASSSSGMNNNGGHVHGGRRTPSVGKLKKKPPLPRRS